MKILVSGILLYEKLSNISKMFDKISSDSVMSNLKFTIYEDHLKLQAMNERISLTEDIYGISTDIACDQTFSFLVDAKTIIQFFKTHQFDVSIELMNNFDIKFVYGNGSFSSVWFDDKVFPDFFYPSSSNHVSIDSSSFISSIKRSFSFVGDDEFRPAIETVLINVKEGHIDIVSTDLQRLFVGRGEIEDKSIDSSIMLSEMAASLLYNYLSGKKTNIDISSDGIRTYLVFDNVIISDMNTECKYPNYEYVCNNFHHTSKIKTDRDTILNSLNAVSIVNSFIDVMVDDEGYVKVKSEDSGNRKSMMEKLSCDIIDGKPFAFTIKKENIVSSIKSLLKGDIILEYSDNSKSIKMYNPKKEDTYILNQTFVSY